MAPKGRWCEASAKSILVQALFQTVIGLGLAAIYRPTVASAYESVDRMPAFLRGLHFWGGALLILHLAVHIVFCLATSDYREDRRRYLAIVLTLLLVIGVQTTGNLLPWDRHGVQTAAIEAGIARQLPIVGTAVSKAMLVGERPTEATLMLWYGMHGIVGFMMLALAGIAAGRGRYPRLPTLAPILVTVVLATLVAPPLASAASPADATTYAAKPGWYVLPIHAFTVGATRWIGEGWIGAALIPALLAINLLLLPFVSKKAQTGLKTVFGILVLVSATLTLVLGLEPAPLYGRRDPSTDSAIGELTANPGQDAKQALEGRQLFATEGCANCHGADGLEGAFGPSLAETHLKQPGPGFYLRYIKNPQSVEPRSKMPPFPDLTQEELRALAEFLRFPRWSGGIP